MLRSFFCVAFLTVVLDSAGQLKDTIQLKIESRRLVSVNETKTQKIDQVKFKQDSLLLLASFNRLRDSLKVEEWSNTLKRKVSIQYSDTAISKSLNKLRTTGIPEIRINHVSDSLQKKGQALVVEIDGSKTALHNKLKDRYRASEASIRSTLKLDSFGLAKSPGLQLPGMNVPNAALPTSQVPGMNVPGLDMPSLATQDFDALGLSPDLKAVGGDMSVPSSETLKAMEVNMPGLPDPLKEFGSRTAELKALKQDPGAAAEKAVGQIDELNSATGQLNDAKGLAENNEALQAAKQMKNPEDIKETIQRQAVNHFAGKEDVLQQAMDNMAKYKQKYESVPSLADVKKTIWPVNGLKGKSFKERFRMGLNLGVKNATDTLFLDFYPNASCRISGRFEAGLGLMYRLRVQTNQFGFDQQHPIWGTTMFVVAKTFKSVFIRVEMDGTSFPRTGSTDQALSRDWRWSFLSGVQTNFRISSSVSGNVQMLYNFDSQLKDGFPERLAVRVGVVYKLKAKSVQSAK